MKRRIITFILLAGAVAGGQSPSPYSNVPFKPATVFTATSQTSSVYTLGQKLANGWQAGSYAMGTVTVTGSSLTTATFSVLGSSDCVNYTALPVAAVATPGTTATTTTVTAAGIYIVPLGGMSCVQFQTSGTFTATSIMLLLTASPNAQIGRGSSSGGGDTITSPGGTITVGGTPTATTLDVTNTSTTVNGQTCTLGSSCTVATPAAPYWQNYGFGTNTAAESANTTFCSGVGLPFAVTAGHMLIYINAADGVNNSDIGWYNSSGTLVAHIGAQTLGSTGTQSFAFTGGTQTIPAGKDYLCVTSAGGTIDFGGFRNAMTFFGYATVSSTTSGGALNGTITPPSDSPSSLGATTASILSVVLEN